MNSLMRQRWFAVILIGISTLFGFCAPVEAQGRKGRILVFTSHGAKPFQDVSSAFIEQLGKMGSLLELESIQLEGDASKVFNILEKKEKGGADVILALGTVAAAAVIGKAGDLPVVVGLVLDSSEMAGRCNVTGVTLDIAPETVLQSIVQVLPGRKRIGVLFDPGRSREKVESASAAGGRMGLSISQERVEKTTDIPQALESLSRKVDLLWGIHDDTVYTPQTAKQVLLFCYQNKIPFVGLSDAWVKAGALFSVDADYREIGFQCAEMVDAILKGQKAGSIPFARPRKLTHSLNLKTAQHMKLEIPARVIQGASEVYR